MHIEQKVNIHNRFDVEVNGKWVGYAENIVLDSIWSRLCTVNSYFANIHFGTGTGVLSAARTTLFTHLGTKTAVNEEQIKAVPVSKWKQKIVLNPEDYVGAILTEVGIAYGATNTNLVTHAMLKDAEGTPITITKTSTDVLTIYATVFVTFNTPNNGVSLVELPTANQLLNYLIGGTSGNMPLPFTLSPQGGPGIRADVPKFTATPTLGDSPTVTWTSDLPNKKRKSSVVRFSVSSGNGHAQAFIFGDVFRVDLTNPSIFPGQNYTAVSLGVGDGIKKDFKLPSKNIKKSSIVAKLNGVETAIESLSDVDREINYRIFTSKDYISGYYITSVIALSGNGLIAAQAKSESPWLEIREREGTVFGKLRPVDIRTEAITSIDLSFDGSILVLTYAAGPLINTYAWNGTNYIRIADPVDMPARAYRVAISDDGLVMAVVFNSSTHKVGIYDRSNGLWVRRVNPTDILAVVYDKLSISADGNTISFIYGLNVEVYKWSNSAWLKLGAIPAISIHCHGATLTPNGLVIGVFGIYGPIVYDLVGNSWVKRGTIPASGSNNYHGGLSVDGNIVVFGEYTTGSFCFQWNGTTWVSIVLGGYGGRSYGAQWSTDCATVLIGTDSSMTFFDTRALYTNIRLPNPPNVGVAVTSDYTVEGVHKTNQYVIDVSFAIQFGGGV